ncbi:MAG TPA: GNAT family N-acetyltransferase [Nevskiaceae bacterium]|nr:GNAT family N-acetyltransferase [Nevskiaceae bacterium]
MDILQTERLCLRPLDAGDAAFMLELLNDPAWLRNIGDRGVRTLEQARDYITQPPASGVQRLQFCIELRTGGAKVGVAGIYRRPTLDQPDLGFALLPAYRGCGYALEAARAVLAHARGALDVRHIAAIAAPGNTASHVLLEKLGLHYQRRIELGAESLCYFAGETGAA